MASGSRCTQKSSPALITEALAVKKAETLVSTVSKCQMFQTFKLFNSLKRFKLSNVSNVEDKTDDKKTKNENNSKNPIEQGTSSKCEEFECLKVWAG